MTVSNDRSSAIKCVCFHKQSKSEEERGGATFTDAASSGIGEPTQENKVCEFADAPVSFKPGAWF